MSRSLSLPATITCAAAALVGFAGNSLLARAALGEATIDAATFTFARLATGALVLALIAGLSRPRQRGRTSAGCHRRPCLPMRLHSRLRTCSSAPASVR